MVVENCLNYRKVLKREPAEFIDSIGSMRKRGAKDDLVFFCLNNWKKKTAIYFY